MRETLKFKPVIMKRVHKLFDEIADQMNVRKNQVTFIGVHNRRTDHLEYSEKEFKWKPLTNKYFYKAMASFRF